MADRERSLGIFRQAATAETIIRGIQKGGGFTEKQTLMFVEAASTDIEKIMLAYKKPEATVPTTSTADPPLESKPAYFGHSAKQLSEALRYIERLRKQSSANDNNLWELSEGLTGQLEIAKREEQEERSTRVRRVSYIGSRVRKGLMGATAAAAVLSLTQLAVGHMEYRDALASLHNDPNHVRTVKLGDANQLIDHAVSDLAPGSWLNLRHYPIHYPSVWNARDRLEEAERSFKSEPDLVEARSQLTQSLINGRLINVMYTVKKDPLLEKREEVQAFQEAVKQKKAEYESNIPQELKDRVSETNRNWWLKLTQLCGSLIVGGVSILGIKKTEQWYIKGT
jgi:hypothetical protein